MDHPRHRCDAIAFPSRPRKRVAPLLLILGLVAQPVQAAEPCFRGINLSGAEFGNPDGVAGTDYLYPSEATIAYFAGKTWATWRIDNYVRKIAFCRKRFPAPVALAYQLRNLLRGDKGSQGGLAA